MPILHDSKATAATIAVGFPAGVAPTAGQAEALKRLNAFLNDRATTTFFLEGAAGTGKTFLATNSVRGLVDSRCYTLFAAATHKACQVIGRNLDRAGIRRIFKPKRGSLPERTVCVDTTAALLGVRPAVHDDESEENQGFAEFEEQSKLPVIVTHAFIQRRRKFVLVVDEVSMLARDQFMNIVKMLKACGGKLVAVGDSAQLPPVDRAPIDFRRDFDAGHELTEVARQAAGNPIIEMAWRVRRGGSWWEIGREKKEDEGQTAEAVVRVRDAAAEFLAHGAAMPSDDESERSVFVAYTNRSVNAVQDLACKRVYGHGAGTFKVGELVIATRAGRREVDYYLDDDGNEREAKFPTYEQIVCVADPLRVREIRTDTVDPLYGTPVLLERITAPPDAPDEDRFFETFYLPGHALTDPENPFVIELNRLRQEAKLRQLVLKQAQAQGAAEHEVKNLRAGHGEAWRKFYAHRDRIFSFSHAFAITSHKSQGSTYRAVYVDAGELARFDRRALYVAATRPAERLVWSWDLLRYPWHERSVS